MTWNTTENLTSSLTDVQNGRQVELWYLLNPTVGSFNVVVTQTGVGNTLAGGNWSAYGAHQTTPYSNTASNKALSGTSATLTVNSVNNELVVALHGNRNSAHTITVDGSWTEDWKAANAASGYTAGMHIAGATSSVSLTNTNSTSAEWIVIGGSIKEFAGSSSVSPSVSPSASVSFAMMRLLPPFIHS